MVKACAAFVGQVPVQQECTIEVPPALFLGAESVAGLDSLFFEDAGLAPLLNLQLRALEATDLEWRLATMEKLLARAEAEGGRKALDETPAHDFGKPTL